MCGIVAAIGLPKAIQAVIGGLRLLEYRGYDSAGVAWQEEGRFRIVRAPGRVKELEEKLEADINYDTKAAMGHTRWATHGPPNEKNSHPHVSQDRRIAVIHNGIIDNFASLKANLEAGGVVFSSDTDTEVVANLIASRYTGGLVQAVEEVLPLLEGTFAIVVMAPDRPDLLVGLRRSSPLCIGVGEGFHLLASDAIPILSYTRRVG
ncbi:MAG: glutamine--fructose-6-phosphate aminotransferase, partial [Planctomycetes bacterium]|nr:glutamine--fructose-6-phosphate aminotransferase [Planctomycetota bacterium]